MIGHLLLVLLKVAVVIVVGLGLVQLLMRFLSRFPSRRIPECDKATGLRIHLRCRPHPLKASGRADLAAAIRRQAAIHAYVGSNGGGKSLAMVHDTLPTLAGIAWSCENPAHLHVSRDGVVEGVRTVLSTVQLLDADGEPHPLCTLFTDYRQLLDLEHADVLMDEVTGVASARQSQGLPAQVENLLVQLRRRDVVLRWTSPDFARADKVMREVTQLVTYCAGSMPAPRSADGRLWRERRLFRWTSFHAADFDDFTVSKREKLVPEGHQWFWRPGTEAETAYKTLDSVAALGVATEAGLCLHCGGRRSAPRCGCVTEKDLGNGLVEITDPRGTRRRVSVSEQLGLRSNETRPAPEPVLPGGHGLPYVNPRRSLL